MISTAYWVFLLIIINTACRHTITPATIGPLVLEIYPLAKGQEEVDKNLRIGFAIDNFQEILLKLKEANIQFFMEPALTEFGYLAVIADPDNRKTELYSKQ